MDVSKSGSSLLSSIYTSKTFLTKSVWISLLLPTFVLFLVFFCEVERDSLFLEPQGVLLICHTICMEENESKKRKYIMYFIDWFVTENPGGESLWTKGSVFSITNFFPLTKLPRSRFAISLLSNTLNWLRWGDIWFPWGWRVREWIQNWQFSIPKFHHSLHPSTITGTRLSPDLRSLDQSDIRSKFKTVPGLVYFGTHKDCHLPSLP